MQFYVFNIRPKLHHRKWRKLHITLTVNRRNMHALFSVCSLRDGNVITSKSTWKLKHTNSILESFEFFCQINMIKIDPYNFELYYFKIGAFFWDTVPYCCIIGMCIWQAVRWLGFSLLPAPSALTSPLLSHFCCPSVDIDPLAHNNTTEIDVSMHHSRCGLWRRYAHLHTSPPSDLYRCQPSCLYLTVHTLVNCWRYSADLMMMIYCICRWNEQLEVIEQRKLRVAMLCGAKSDLHGANLCEQDIIVITAGRPTPHQLTLTSSVIFLSQICSVCSRFQCL